MTDELKIHTDRLPGAGMDYEAVTLVSVPIPDGVLARLYPAKIIQTLVEDRIVGEIAATYVREHGAEILAAMKPDQLATIVGNALAAAMSAKLAEEFLKRLPDAK